MTSATENLQVDEMYAAKCDLCQAAHAVQDNKGDMDNDVLESVAKRFQVPLSLLKRRLGIGAKRTSWTPTMVEQLQKDVDEGLTTTELAEKWELTTSRMNQLITQHEIDLSKGRRTRTRREIARVQQLIEPITTVLDIEPDLNVSALHGWVVAFGNVKDASLEEVQNIVDKLGIKLGELDALPGDKSSWGVDEEEAKAKPKRKPKKGTPSAPPADAAIEDVPLPGVDKTDDVVEVVGKEEKGRMLDHLIQFFQETGTDATIEDYTKWAEKNDAPSSKDFRHEYGSWQNARNAALAVLQQA